MDEPVFGRYRLQELIGRGGMGEVYRALDTVKDRVVAVKLLAPALAPTPRTGRGSAGRRSWRPG